MKAYRPEIDGLRSMAIVPVVLFHAGIDVLSGGFVGVDIFFVISGFLITTLISTEIERGDFSIVTFYERRIRRLFPALFTVLLISSAVALWLLLPDDLMAFGRSLAAAILFGSNVLFWREAGYFSGDEKPLLHTWSLAVEEQFYIVFPLLLILLMRLRQRALPWVALLGLASFACSLLSLKVSPSATFYLLPTRAWELALGAVAALGAFPPISSRPLREVLGWLGVLLIGIAIFAYSPAVPFPGWRALLPCVGALLIIVSTADGESTVRKMLRMAPFVGVGLISYSLYLWHWPLIVFAKYYLQRPFAAHELALLLAASVLAACISWKFVEQPFRRKGGVLSRRALFPVAGGAMAALVAAGMGTLLTEGLPQRAASVVAAAPWVAKMDLLANEDRRDCLSMPREADGRLALDRMCRLGAGTVDKPDFVVWGDSHAEAIRSAVGTAAQKAGYSGYFIGRDGCMPALGVEIYANGRARDCPQTAEKAVEAILAHPEITQVFIAARWAIYFEGTRAAMEQGPEIQLEAGTRHNNPQVFSQGLQATVDVLSKAGRQVYLVLDVPEVGYDVPRAMGLELWHGRALDIRPAVAQFHARAGGASSVIEQLRSRSLVSLIRPSDILCAGRDSCIIESGGKPLYFDDNHLSRFGAQLVSAAFDSAFRH